MTQFLKPGDEVAILPRANSPAANVLEIATIREICSVFLRVDDGRFYGTIGGKSLLSKVESYAVPATDQHRAALKARTYPLPVPEPPQPISETLTSVAS